MTVKFGFYDSLNSDRLYNANDISTMFEGLFGDGVFQLIDGGLNVTLSPGTMNVIVASGRAMFNNLWIRNTSSLILSLSQSDLIQPRIDLVILEFNSDITVRTNSIKILTGTPSATPIPPLLSNTSTLKQYALAEIYIPASASQPSSITNKIGTVNTPYVSNILPPKNLPLPTTTVLGGVKRNIRMSKQFVKGIDASGNLEYEIPESGKEVLTSNRVYYVRTDGADSHDGLTNTSSGAFLTIQQAVNTITNIDINGYTVTIQLGDGTYDESVILKNIVGFSSPGDLIIQGNATNPTNVVISSSTNSCFIKTGSGSVWRIQNLKVTSIKIGGYGLYALNGGYIEFSNINFGSFNSSSGCHIVSRGAGSNIIAVGNYSISGGGYIHIWADYGGLVNVSARTVTISNSPTFVYYAVFSGLGCIVSYSQTFINGNTITGTRHYGYLNGITQTNGNELTFYPGTINGNRQTGSQWA